jgi:Domain of unknown function (DUF4190)
VEELDVQKVSMITSWQPPSRAQRTNPLAIAALACGIVQFCGVWPAGIAAIILGHRARGKIRRNREVGYGMATAGVIPGYTGIAPWASSGL